MFQKKVTGLFQIWHLQFSFKSSDKNIFLKTLLVINFLETNVIQVSFQIICEMKIDEEMTQLVGIVFHMYQMRSMNGWPIFVWKFIKFSFVLYIKYVDKYMPKSQWERDIGWQLLSIYGTYTVSTVYHT